VLYCFFIIGHDRRRIVNFNVTSHPTAGWIIQQLREAFPYQSAPRFLIFDVISASLQACEVGFPFAIPTSICRSRFTICSGLYLHDGSLVLC
jgi:hypothetical protein